MQTTKIIKKQLAVAVATALLALPLGTTLAFAETAVQVETTSTATTNDTTTDTTNSDTASTDTSSTDTSSTDTASTDTTTPDDEDIDEETESTAVTDVEGNEIDPSNWVSDLIGKIQIALTFDPARKCELNQQQALAKLAKAQKLMVEGKTEESEIAFSEYTDKIAKAQEFLEKVEDPDSEEAKRLTIALTNVNQNNVKVLGELLDKLPPQAAQKLALNIVRSMEKAVSKMEKQEARISTVTTPETLPETTENSTDPEIIVTKNKSLEKQAKVVLKEFKKSLKQNPNIQLEDDQDDEDQDQTVADDEVATIQDASMTDSQPTSVTVAPAELQSEQTRDRSSEKEKGKQSKQDDKSKDRDGDEKQDKQRDNK